MVRAGKFMLIGEIEAGKTTLINALFGKDEAARKTQAIEFEGQGMDTPGEYFSHPRLYSALISMSPDIDTLVYVHPADRPMCRLPPGLLDIYAGKTIIGVVTKVDLPTAEPERIERMLRDHGIPGPIFRISPQQPTALAALRTYLLGAPAVCEDSL